MILTCTATEGQESDAKNEEADENESESAGIEGGQGDAGGNQTPQKAEPPSFNDVLRTPQLSDFGLSEMQLKRSLAGAEWCSQVLKVKGMFINSDQTAGFFPVYVDDK